MTIDLVDVDLSGVGTDELEAGLCSFQARLSAATASYVLAVAEFDRRRGWEPWECRSMAHWLSWKCGTGLVAAREQVRVGAALTDLPVTRDRFCSGRLSYSQVRAITRVATSDTDQVLAELADAMTAAQLEEVVRAFRRSNKVDEATAVARRAERRLSASWDDDGMLVGRFYLPAEEGAVVLKALEVMVGPAEAQAAAEDRGTDGWAAARADALVAMATAALEGDRNEEGDANDRHLVNILVDEATLGGTADDPGEGTCEVEHGPGLAPETVRRLACDAPTVKVSVDGQGGVLDVGRRTRRIGRRLRRALAHRDGGCRYPGCTARRTQAHHIVHWADGGATNMDNLVSLCPRHHHRHHEGAYRIEHPLPGRLIFVRADGRVVPDQPTITGTCPGGGLTPTGQPHTCHWEGGPLPMADILDAIHQAAGTLLTPTRPPACDSAETPTIDDTAAPWLAHDSAEALTVEV